MNGLAPAKQSQCGTLLTEALSALCKAAGDPLRLAVLRVLSQDSFGVLELSQIFEFRQSGMSHHLKILLQAGLVTTRARRYIWIAVSNCPSLARYQA